MKIAPEKVESARSRLLETMLDCAFHSWRTLQEVGGNRYAARLLELRRLGYAMESRDLGDGGKEYRLLSPVPGTCLSGCVRHTEMRPGC